MNVVLHGFYNRDGQTARRSDETLYRGQFIGRFQLIPQYRTFWHITFRQIS